jgi:hypothetical protein
MFVMKEGAGRSPPEPLGGLDAGDHGGAASGSACPQASQNHASM